MRNERRNHRILAAGMIMIVGVTMYQLTDNTQKYLKSLEGKPFDPMAILSIVLVGCYLTFRLPHLLEHYIGIFANNGHEPVRNQPGNAARLR